MAHGAEPGMDMRAGVYRTLDQLTGTFTVNVHYQGMVGYR